MMVAITTNNNNFSKTYITIIIIYIVYTKDFQPIYIYKTELIYNKKLDHAYVAYTENFIIGLLDSYHGVGMCATTHHQQTGLYSA